jgi:hypothetical protein
MKAAIPSPSTGADIRKRRLLENLMIKPSSAWTILFFLSF